MNDFIAIENLNTVFTAKRLIPTITLWNRLEGRPRRHDFSKALEARVGDALWMLTKQWQMGEFRGDDAGSPITAKAHIETTQFTKYQPAGQPAEAFADDVPLEAKVEQRPISFRAGDQAMTLDIRVAMGRRWLKLVDGIELGLREKFIAALGFAEPDPSDPAQAAVCAHRESWQAVAALAGRAMDGYALYEHLTAAAGNHAHDLIALDNAASAPAIEDAETTFLDWYHRLFYQPADGHGDAWLPEQLEYAFSASAPQEGGEKHMIADEYYHGHLDWYNLDIDPKGAGLGPVPDAPVPTDVQAKHTATFIPTPIRFEGMPHTRWWTFEDGTTNFGDIDPETTEINKLLVMEFSLIFANDWFMLPFTVPAGTIAKVRGMAVTNVFGERIWIEAAGRGLDDDWQRWSMFTLAIHGSDEIPADFSLLVLPSVPKIQEGDPVEAIELVRDEVANMVWGVETRVPLPHGETKIGRGAARETARYHRRLVEEALGGPPPAPALIENDAAIRYQVMTRVPENWIPFIPVHIENSTREIQLRRAAMPRIIEGDPNPLVKIRPRSALLRHGLEANPAEGYDLHEEEVPRAGIRVTQSFQRTRWYNGGVFLWLGVRKRTGRGERSSGLRFDQIRPKRR
jgi:hypothetical protein